MTRRNRKIYRLKISSSSKS